jgi:hypothetical protein
MYLVEHPNRCAKVEVGKITRRPLLENIHILVVEGWCQVWIMEVPPTHFL